MKITIYSADGNDCYSIRASNENKKIWISARDGEGGEFDADKVSEILFSAIDKFYKNNL